MPALPKDRKPYMLWVNYGTEGWALHSTSDDPCELLDEARSAGLSEEWVIVREIKFVPVKGI